MELRKYSERNGNTRKNSECSEGSEFSDFSEFSDVNALLYPAQHGAFEVGGVVDERLAARDDTEGFGSHLQTAAGDGVGLCARGHFLLSLFGEEVPLLLREVDVGFLFEFDGGEDCGLGFAVELDGEGGYDGEHI